MTVFVPVTDPIRPRADWRDPDNYRWMTPLPKSAWAWEFLRRNPAYRAAYDAHGRVGTERTAPAYAEAAAWSLLRFEDPERDAREADVLWQMKSSLDVLPLAASPMRPGTAVCRLKLEHCACRTLVYDYGVEDRREVLLAQDGRTLQLTIFGATPLGDALLLTPALPFEAYGKRRLLLVRRLRDVVKHGWLRPSLYKRERRAIRLVAVAQALDGWLSHAPQREIAAALFAHERVQRDWNDPRNHMRDHVRRAVAYGRELMLTKYRRFLM